MTIIYRWYIFDKYTLTLSQPKAYRDEYDELYVLADYYQEHKAVQALDEYLQWDCPHRISDFVLQKIYQK